MNKMNKKGFTLIEMLVVIAIIAVLVSIIIPVVGNSTVKASAATNAANLRSVVAAVSIKYMEDPDKFLAEGAKITVADGVATLPAKSGEDAETLNAPGAKSVVLDGTTYSAKDTQMTIEIKDNAVVAMYNGYTINNFADIAEDGKFDGTKGK